jgi:hypothetical protein
MERFQNIKRFQQPGKVECGPAVVCAAVSVYPDLLPKFSVDSVITAAGINDIVKNGGTTVSELAKAVEVLTEKRLGAFYKVGGTIDDIQQLLDQKVPVIVDWQGSTFVGSDGGRGHYSLVTDVDNQGNLHMVDSLPDFPEIRKETINSFERAWWDTDTVLNPSGKGEDIQTKHLLFIVVPESESAILIQQFNLFPGNTYPGNKV